MATDSNEYRGYELNDDEEDDLCWTSSGEGFFDLEDHPELWGEDCLSEMNRSVVCPNCKGSGNADDCTY